jgi:methylenetetrahydrofolate--tRNA-(uracil-5-)-methyltransferase
MKEHSTVLFAGQICGVEGYVESIATGMQAGIHAAALVSGNVPIAPLRATALGSLVNYVTNADPKKFQPANITFDLLPPLEKRVRDRQQRHKMQCDLALRELGEWLKIVGASTEVSQVS